MVRSIRLMLLLALVCAAPAVARAQEQPDVMSLIRKAVENDNANDKKAREYMYVQREESKKKQGNGFKTEVKTSEIFYLYGDRFKRVIAWNDNPLSEKEAKKEEERIAKQMEKHKQESEKDRRKNEEKAEKDREEERKFLDEVAQAYDFKLQGLESVGGRDAWVISGEPRRDFHPKSKEEKILPKIRFKAWIDKEETEWVKVEAEVIDNITFGLFLAKLDKGAHFTLEQARINDEIWLPQHVAVAADARLLFKHFDIATDITYRDYRKFRTESKITGVVDSQTPPPPPPQP
jgi:hypothetical protein